MNNESNKIIIDSLLDKKVSIGFLPTPIYLLKNLTKKLNGPNIYIKRDDQTGLAFGGNKTRKLDYLVYDALKNNCDIVITVGAPQSNHCRQTVAACNVYNIECYIIMVGHKSEYKMQGNILLDNLLNSKIIFIEDESKIEITKDNLIKELKNKGKNPYYVPAGGSNTIGSLGYINAFKEILDQEIKIGVKFDYVVFASSSFGTQTGLEIGNIVYGNSNKKIYGVSITKKFLELRSLSNEQKIIEMISAFDKDFKTSIISSNIVSDKDVILDSRFNEAGYAVMSKEDLEAIELFARTESILLDPVYSGRAGAGLIHMIRNNEIPKSKNVLFLYTGGAPALFTDLFKPKF